MRYYSIKRIFFLLLMIGCSEISAQSLELTLQHTINMANEQSLDAFRARYMLRIKSLEYDDFKTALLPKLSLGLTPVNYTRSITEVYNYNDQKYESVEIQRLTSQYNIGIQQKVGFTGGDISIYSDLKRSQRYGSDNDNLDFISTPFSISYRHNFSNINQYKWKAKIEPLKFEKAKLDYLEGREQTAIKATDLFFNLLTAQTNMDIARLNQMNADSLLSIGRKRKAIGSITRDDLLNLELKQVNASIKLDQSGNTLESARLDLCDFLELPLNTKLSCIAPKQVLLGHIDPKNAQEQALLNNPDIHDLTQKLLEAEKQVITAKRSRFNVDMELGFGYNQNRPEFTEAFQDLLDRQNMRLSMNIPLVDWKSTKRNIQRAALNKELVEKNNAKIQQQLMLSIAKNTNEFNLKLKELNSAATADTISQLAYEATQQRFGLGKVNVIAINEAYQSMYSAKNSYISALRNYWKSYYTMRRLCLFDFEKKENLMRLFDKLMDN
ncbi:TolC family protein [Puteibacter caeruleilacunae]|nr:TolC family protein [Puteibacter caeruleilacunae]